MTKIVIFLLALLLCFGGEEEQNVVWSSNAPEADQKTEVRAARPNRRRVSLRRRGSRRVRRIRRAVVLVTITVGG